MKIIYDFINKYKTEIILIIIIIIIFLYLYYYNYDFFDFYTFNTAQWPRRLSTFGLSADSQKQAMNAMYYWFNNIVGYYNIECSDSNWTTFPNPAGFYYTSGLTEIAVEGSVNAGMAKMHSLGEKCHRLKNENPYTELCSKPLPTMPYVYDYCNCQGNFSNWSECSSSCGGGEQTRTYFITRPPATDKDIKCIYNNGYTETQPCNTQPCPIHCEGSYGEFSQCSASCGGGTQTKPYNVEIQPLYGGDPCPTAITEPCNTQPCPIHCEGSYGEFSQCSASCGGGTQTKTYEITTPPQYGGTPCPTAITQPCNTQPCPIHCEGSYGGFSQCSKTCGGGTQTKTYEITTPPQYGGTPCPTAITQPCNTQPCPIHCEGSYGGFSQCSKTCGGGTQTKTYEITTPPQYGGTPCPTAMTEPCNTQPCPLDCIGNFLITEKCSKECGGGKETIKYTITQEAEKGGKPCEYTDGYTDRIDCNIFECENKLDTLYYKSFKPLEYDEDRAYYWSRDKLVEEGIRRNQDDLQKIQNLQTLFENETDEKNKKKLQDELDLYKWRDSILESKDKKTGLSRDKRDIITDYYPEEIGLNRPWIERHSHLPDYSY
jgi:hypothetical protein